LENAPHKLPVKIMAHIDKSKINGINRLLFTFLLAILFFISIQPARAQKWVLPELKIPISEKLTNALKTAPQPCPSAKNPNQVCVTWIGDYIGEIFNYVVAVAGILAVVVMMVGGFLWLMSGGNQERAANGKAYIASALSGLVLVLFSYTLLNFVNPDLINLTPIRITLVEENKNGCPACPVYTTCQKTNVNLGGVSVTSNNNSYECLNILPGKCEMNLSIKIIGKSPVLESKTWDVSNEMECRKNIDREINRLINKYINEKFDISLSKYEYIPSTNSMFGETIADPPTQEENVQ